MSLIMYLSSTVAYISTTGAFEIVSRTEHNAAHNWIQALSVALITECCGCCC